MSLQFDRATHTYTLNGEIIPSVTKLLKNAGIVYRGVNYSQEAADRGTAVHEEISGIITHNNRPTSAYGFVFLDFISYLGEKISGWQSEKLVYNMLYGYAGTADIIAYINGVESVIEIKTGYAADWHKMQVAAYAQALEISKAYILYISETSFKLVTVNVQECFKSFVQATGLVAEGKEEIKEKTSSQQEYDTLTQEYDRIAKIIDDTTNLYKDAKESAYASHRNICKEEKIVVESHKQAQVAIKKRMVELLNDESLHVKMNDRHSMVVDFVPEIDNVYLIPLEYMMPNIEKIKEMAKKLGPIAEKSIPGVKIQPAFSLRVRNPSPPPSNLQNQ